MADEAASASGELRARRPRRRKKKGAKAAEAERPVRKRARNEDRELAARPPFAAAYPRHRDVERLLEAFEQGNFAYVRHEAPRVIESADDEEVRQAARDLRRRIEPEPTSLVLWALGVALLVFLYGYYLSV